MIELVALAAGGAAVAAWVLAGRGAPRAALEAFVARHGAAEHDDGPGRGDNAEARPTRYAVTRKGAVVSLGLGPADDGPFLDVVARVVTPPAVAVVRRRGWGRRPLPNLDAAVWRLPVLTADREAHTCTDDRAALARLQDLAAAWARLADAARTLVLACDGRRVVGRLASPVSLAAVEAMVDAVAALALDDRGLGEALATLPAAKRIEDRWLLPAVALAPDDLVLGVEDGARMVADLVTRGLAPTRATAAGGEVLDDGGLPPEVVAALRRCGDATLEVNETRAWIAWVTVERDLARLRAGVEALRALTARSGPFR